jgi:hypothetical protein
MKVRAISRRMGRCPLSMVLTLSLVSAQPNEDTRESAR